MFSAGEGHVFTPAAAVILMALMLSLKPQLSRFAVGLNAEEVRGAVLLALIAFVIYPVLPNRFVDPWGLFNPREDWLIIVLISAIGFVNYLLLRLFSERGIYYTAVFGGLINSTAAIAELSTLLRNAGENTGGAGRQRQPASRSFPCSREMWSCWQSSVRPPV